MGKYVTDLSAAGLHQYSLLGDKLLFLEFIAEAIKEVGVQGHIAEAGVYKGGSAKLLATIFNDREIYLFDSFQGMLEDDEHDGGGHRAGDFSDTTLQSVMNYLKDNQNCKFYPGWFPDSAEFFTDEKFAMVHLDMDYYQSTRSGIEVFWPRISQGGILVLDDYGWKLCPGVDRAFDEYFGSRQDYQVIDQSWTHNNQNLMFRFTIAIVKL